MNRKDRGYAGGYHYQPQVYGFMYPYQAQRLDGFGSDFKKRIRSLQPGMMTLDGYGKVLARPDNRVTVDPSRPDAYGIPIPVVHFRFGENDRLLWKEMGEKAHEILEAAKSRFMFSPASDLNGFASHETGTIRMGSNPRTSVLNSFCQAHDVKNLFVVDGSCFTTFPEKNPTHTIMALSVRTSRYIASELKKRNL
jgi:choline dehydrogenase-like flavoprotein